MHGARDALEYGVKVTGATLFVVDEGVDTGPIVEQTVVPSPAAILPNPFTNASSGGARDAGDTVGRMARNGFTISGRKVTIP